MGVGLVRFIFVVLEKNTLAVTKGGWFSCMCAESTTCNFDVSKCEFPLRGLNDLTDYIYWTYGFLRVRIFIGEGRSQSGGR